MAETTFWGLQTPETILERGNGWWAVVGKVGKKMSRAFYKVLFESQVKKHTVLYARFQSGGWVARSGTG